jgi:hypothetical protein
MIYTHRISEKNRDVNVISEVSIGHLSISNYDIHPV